MGFWGFGVLGYEVVKVIGGAPEGWKTFYLSELVQVINGYSYLRDHDVIIAKITPCFENGKGAIAKDLVNGIAFATTEVITLRPNHSDSSKYLYYLLFCSPFRKYAEGTMYGAGGIEAVTIN